MEGRRVSYVLVYMGLWKCFFDVFFRRVGSRFFMENEDGGGDVGGMGSKEGVKG